MRKFLNIIGLSTVLLFASCEVERFPHSQIPGDGLFNDIQKIEALENGAYLALESCYSPVSTIVPDLGTDYVHAVQGFTNTYGDIYRWTFVQSTSELYSVWGTCYLAIGQYNYILDNIKDLTFDFDPTLPDNEGKIDPNARLQKVRGHVHLMRAMTYSILAERFCADYDEATAKNAFSGVPKISTYDPSLRNPDRASLDEIYALILTDITQAKTDLKDEVGAPNSIRLNRDCVTALEAHVYLQMDLYAEALIAANSLIGNSAYALATSYEEFTDVWTYDKGKEIIFKFAASKEELPSAYGMPLYFEQTGGAYDKTENLRIWGPDYIPTQATIDAFSADDFRKKAWFYVASLETNDQCYIGNQIAASYTMISKFPGNPELRTDESWNFANTWKVFRLAEMYLIAAEAAAQSTGDAATPLNALRATRNLPALPAVTMADVKKERFLELMCEGYRNIDLKRWGEGFQRGKSQVSMIYVIDPIKNTLVPTSEGEVSTVVGRSLKVDAGDYRFLWPIPADEIYSNPTLGNQQNPGWGH